MKAYPAYKESGVEWLGDIPTHWNIWELRNLFRKTSIKNRPDLPLLSVVREQGVIIRDVESKEENHNFIPDDLSKYKVLKRGQFVINKMKAWQGSYAVSELTGIVSPAYFIYDVDYSELLPSFFNLAIRSKSYVSFFNKASDGVRIGQWDLDETQMRDIPLFVPPLAEQAVIVTYLDKKCADIDELMSRRQAIIERLKELKQSIIAEAVTKGLNPDVPMKDSGVKWLGHIPAHWETKYPKALFALRKSRAAKGEKQLTSSQHHGVIYQEDYMRLTGNRIVTVLKDFDILKHVEAGDFVISMRSFQGGIEYSPYTGSISSAYVMLIPNRDYVHPAYFKWLLKSHGYIKALQSTSNLVRDGQAMRYANFVQVRLPYLPMAEQESIAHHLDKKCAEIDALISRQEQIIEKLKELKTSTIAHVVTGKVDVRDTL